MDKAIVLIGVFLAAIQSLGAGAATRPELRTMTWEVDGVTRKALVYIPAAPADQLPIVFAFHGHGGRSEFAARTFDFHTLWPEAICVYPQGLPTKTPIDPEGKRPGWQRNVGDDGDRDLKFFDAMLKTFTSEDHADPKRVCISGFSNGAFFTYLLLSSRPDAISAIAPVAGLLSEQEAAAAKPKPIFHVAGKTDPLVKFADQEQTIQLDLKLDHCDPDGKADGPLVTKYSSDSGPTVFTLIHNGGHEVPAEATMRIVEFFKLQKQ
jgi:polyhydroxybutyrate depolymerase